MNEPVNTLSGSLYNPWMFVAALLFTILIVIFFVKFFSIFFEFIQAKGCLTVGLIALAGFPGIVVLCLVSGYAITSTVIIVMAVIGAVTGYIARDSEGDVGKFGNFILIVSVITLVLALFFTRIMNFLK
jgi:hypothetical protein